LPPLPPESGPPLCHSPDIHGLMLPFRALKDPELQTLLVAEATAALSVLWASDCAPWPRLLMPSPQAVRMNP
jgi:hypothetical protein